MTTTVIKKGQLITSTSTEQDLALAGPYEDGTVQTVYIELVSGTVQFTTGPAEGSPVINATYRTYSTAGDKIILTVQTGKHNLRCVGSGTFSVTW